jgi:N-acetyl-gamma-glutamyl-phosphate reductase
LTTRVRVGVYGASGYAGMDLVALLARHPQVELSFGTSNTYADQAIDGTALRYIAHEQAPQDGVDMVFLALPHGVAAKRAAQARAAGLRVIDLSADLRLDSAAAYERWYGGPHPHPDLLHAPYGLPEINRAALHAAPLIAAPGCYPTTTLLGLYPLLRAAWLDSHAPIIVDAKSGVSGAGREPKANTHFVEVLGNFTPYKIGRSHRHVGEIEQEMHKLCADVGTLIFTPHLLPTDRGLLASIYVTLQDGRNAADAHALYSAAYADEPLVTVLPAGEVATLRHAVRTNRCVISVHPVGQRYVQITSVIDNLRKGASSQAIQCFNLMYGFQETDGLC